MNPQPLIVRALRDPDAIAGFTTPEWDLLIRQARSGNLLARLWYVFECNGLLGDVPPQPRRHLEWARTFADKLTTAVHLEVAFIQNALPAEPIILLKGAAYVLAGLPPAYGRIFSDIDILVPKGTIDKVESQLMMHGWIATHHDEYDQRYYREWMHEVPPLQNVKRGTVIDVHHAILPLTMGVHPDADSLRAAATPINGHEGLYTLAPIDIVLHSAAHLFYEGELFQGLRDLSDLDGLIRHFSIDAKFWEHLVARAQELELIRVLFYALVYTRKFFSTPIPEAVISAADIGRPPALVLALMNAILSRVLLPDHVSCRDTASVLARKALYVRANWLRMPPLLLALHLFHKAFISRKEG